MQDIENIEAKTEILMQSLAEYGKKFLKEIDGKNSEDLAKGGREAGFSKWKTQEDFCDEISRQCTIYNMENNIQITLDTSSPNTDDMKNLAKISAELQRQSKTHFSAAAGKHYEDGTKDMTRSWRLALGWRLALARSELKEKLPSSEQSSSLNR